MAATQAPVDPIHHRCEAPPDMLLAVAGSSILDQVVAGDLGSRQMTGRLLFDRVLDANNPCPLTSMC